MTTYEDAPSTILLATHCARCGRPLRDAVSVECGMGPDCREAIGMVVGAEATPEHAEANKVVHAAACAPRNERAPFVGRLIALGFPRLAEAVAKGAGEVVTVRHVGERYAVIAPFNEGFNAALRAARIGARWDRDIDTGRPRPGAWTVPGDARAKAGLFGVLKATFGGALLVSEKGTTVIPAA